MRLLQELSERPAMNGGFKKLSKQQTIQCRRLERLERDMGDMHQTMKKLERDMGDMGDIHQTMKWLKRIGTAIFVGVVVELAVKGADHLHVVLH